MMLVLVVSYIWLEQRICIACEKCRTKYLLEIMMLVLVVSSLCLEQLICMACEKCKTKYLFEIMMLVALVSYLWLDQLICIAREKCKTKYMYSWLGLDTSPCTTLRTRLYSRAPHAAEPVAEVYVRARNNSAW
ncbi:hypothetical protein DPMN_069041 [Dreissena polymorpha]|uniref:Uncharacterized protein n=1 Tax=Dreissena polymorpha TaxID=45954 RepID=A0A9D4BUP4_DREPO|nr:hypothetical protein DPMN_069041 [Dreissena polymorpha]